MARLTDTQLVVLSAASQREDRGVELPANVQGKAAGKIVDKLIRAGLLEEVGASGSLPVWRRDDESGAIALRITSAGLAAIAAADEVMVTPEENGELSCIRRQTRPSSHFKGGLCCRLGIIRHLKGGSLSSEWSERSAGDRSSGGSWFLERSVRSRLRSRSRFPSA
jgi:hypothetical protein